ncbi:MAG TPA: L,D-transpeptidase [Solirubrobacterales bacterium]|jgi:lipoprotein-anchoring transpeptidase ErfK/SrfK|nr:L,D-transpeptidase [Solirubrobacterales bacterium]
MDGVSERLSTFFGALVAAALVVGAFVLLIHVLDSGGGDTSATTIVRVQVPAGTTSTGKTAKPGHAALGTKTPQHAAAPAPTPSARPASMVARPARGPAFEIVRIREGARVDLESAPGGPVVAKLGDQTEFGSPASFSVVETKPGWLGITTPELPDGEIGWIARDPTRVAVYWTRYSLHADLAGRSLELRYGDKVVGRWSVSVGAPGTETPPGRYGVTDGVAFHESPYYGCCALALSGHQDQALPAGWIGGNRLAIHGTPGSVGGAESLGCIRATDETMRFLFARVPLGTPVFVDA